MIFMDAVCSQTWPYVKSHCVNHLYSGLRCHLTCYHLSEHNQRMTVEDIKEHFGTLEKARRALEFKSRHTIYNWKARGVPKGQQYRLQLLTGGLLRVDTGANGKNKKGR